MDKGDEKKIVIVQEALATSIDLMVIYVLLGESVAAKYLLGFHPELS